MDGKIAYMFPGISGVQRIDSIIHESFMAWLKSSGFDFSPFLVSNSALYHLKNKEYGCLSFVDMQIIGYAISCVIYDSCIKKNKKVDYTSGYSVGIFAALYAARAISFESGLLLIRQLNELITSSDFFKGKKFSMAAVIGLDKKDLSCIVEKVKDVEIINDNSRSGFIVSGEMDSIINLNRELLEKNNLLLFKMLPITMPFHSSALKQFKKEWVYILSQQKISPPRIPILSAIRLDVLTTNKSCISELEDNFYSPFSWFGLLKKTRDLGVKDIYQCGINKDLQNIGKYSGIKHNYHRCNIDG